MDIGHLIEENLALLTRECRKYCNNKADADDLLQDACLHMLYRQNNYDSGRPFMPWARRIVFTTFVDQYRSDIRCPIINDPELDASEELAFEVTEIVGTIMSQLNTEDRQLLEMTYLDDKSQEEIAISLGVHQSSISRRLFRAKENFKEKYFEHLKCNHRTDCRGGCCRTQGNGRSSNV